VTPWGAILRSPLSRSLPEKKGRMEDFRFSAYETPSEALNRTVSLAQGLYGVDG